MTTNMKILSSFMNNISVGDDLNWTKDNFGYRNDGRGENNPRWNENPTATIHGGVIENIKDFCDLLDIPPEFALKVKIGQVRCPPVAEIVKDLYNENVLMVVFKVECCLFSEKELGTPDTADSLPDDTTKVTGKDWGRKLIVVLKLMGRDEDRLKDTMNTFFFEDKLPSKNEAIDDKVVKDLQEKWAPRLDSKLAKNGYSDIKKTIQYFTFFPYFHFSTTVTGMLEVIIQFYSSCKSLTSISSDKYIFNRTPMSLLNIRDSESHYENLPDGQQFFELTETVYEMSIAVKARTRTGNLRDFYKLAENLLKRMRSIEKGGNQICEIINPSMAVMRDNADDYGAQQRYLHLNDSQSQIQQAIKEMVLGQSVDAIFYSDPALECLRVTSGGQIDLVLLGKTGQGKSSTGNSILMGERFQVSGNPASLTLDNNLQEANIDGRMLNVADTPGLFDTRINLKGVKEHAVSFLKKLMFLQPDGFHALLYVFKYGERMSEDHKNSVLLLKRALGDNVVMNHVVCIITGGDLFGKQNDNFNKWCHDTGSKELNKLFKECQYRCVLFNNETDDENEKKYQVIRLVSMVDTIPCRYTNGEFEKANSEQEEILREAMSQEIKHAIENYLSLLSTHVNLGEVLEKEELQSLDDQENLAKKLAKEDKKSIRNWITNIRSSHENNKVLKFVQEKKREEEKKEMEQEKRRKETKKQIDNYLDFVNEELEFGNEINEITLKKLESYERKSYDILFGDDRREIQNRIKIMMKKSKKICQAKEEEKKNQIITDKRQEISLFLQYVNEELEDGKDIDRVTLQKLEEYKTDAIQMFPEQDNQEIKRKITDLKDNSDKIHKEKEEIKRRTAKQREINNFLQLCENDLRAGNEMDQGTHYMLENYERDAKQDLSDDDYNRIQEKIKELKMESKKSRVDRVEKEKRNKELDIIKEIDIYLEDVRKHLTVEQIIPKEKMQKLNYYEMVDCENLPEDDKKLITEKIKVLKEKSEKTRVIKKMEKKKKEINKFLQLCENDLTTGNEMDQGTHYMLENYERDAKQDLSKDDYNKIQEKIKELKMESEKIRVDRVEKEKRKKELEDILKEINCYLEDVQKHVTADEMIPEEKIQKLNYYEMGDCEKLPEDDKRMIKEKIKVLKDKTEKIREVKKRTEKKGEIDNFLQICENDLSAGNEMDQGTHYKIENYERDAEQDLSKDDYNKIQEKIKELKMESEKIRNDKMEKKKRKRELEDMIKEVNAFLDDIQKHVTADEMIPEEKIQKSKYFEMDDWEKLLEDDKEIIKEKIQVLEEMSENIREIKKRTEKKREISNFAQLCENNLTAVSEMDQVTNYTLEKYNRDTKQDKPEDDYNKIQENIKKLKFKSKRVREDTIKKEERGKELDIIKEINCYLEDVQKHVTADEIIPEEKIEKLNYYEMGDCENLPEDDKRMIKEKIKVLKDKTEKIREVKKRTEKKGEIDNFLQICENDLSAGNEMDQGTHYMLENYERDAKQDLSDDDYNKIQEKIKELKMESEKIRVDRVEKEKRKIELENIRKEINCYLEDVQKHVTADEMIPEEKIQKLNYYEMVDCEKLPEDDKRMIKEKIKVLKDKTEKIREVKKRTEIKGEIDNFLEICENDLTAGNEMDEVTHYMLENYERDAKQDLPEDDYNRIQETIKELKMESEKIRNARIEKEKRKREDDILNKIFAYLEGVEKHIRAEKEIPEEKIPTLNYFELVECEKLPENDKKMIRNEIRILKEKSEQIRKMQKRAEKKREINTFLKRCEKNLRAKNEMNEVTLYKLEKYERDAKHDLPENDYNSIQQKIKELKRESEKIFHEKIKIDKRSKELGIIKEINDYINDCLAHVSAKEMLPCEKIEKLNHYELVAMEKLPEDDTTKIIRKMRVLLQKSDDLRKDSEIQKKLKAQLETSEKLDKTIDLLNELFKKNRKIKETDFQALTDCERLIKENFPEDEQGPMLQKIKDVKEKFRQASERTWSKAKRFMITYGHHFGILVKGRRKDF